MEWIANWWWATILGPIILGAVMIYALSTRRKLTPTEKKDQVRAINELYEDPQGSSNRNATAPSVDNKD